MQPLFLVRHIPLFFFLQRLANLYRPAANIHGLIDEESTATTSNVPPPDSSTNSTTDLPSAEDPPPKYTPPPSYSTATGTR